MAVGNPSGALATLQPLDELGPVGNGMRDSVRRGDRPGRAVRDRPFTELSPNALLGEAPEAPSLRF